MTSSGEAEKRLRLSLLDDRLAVCRLAPDAALPSWLAWRGDLVSVTRTGKELSVVCPQGAVPSDVAAERDWRAFEVEGPLDFALTGVLAGLATPLAEAGIGIFVLSTYDTDYLLVRAADLQRAQAVLSRRCDLT